MAYVDYPYRNLTGFKKKPDRCLKNLTGFKKKPDLAFEKPDQCLKNLTDLCEKPAAAFGILEFTTKH